MVLEGVVALLVHIAGVPLIGVTRHRIESPVDEDAELAVLVPIGRRVLLQRFPIVLEGALLDDRVYFLDLLVDLGFFRG